MTLLAKVFYTHPPEALDFRPTRSLRNSSIDSINCYVYKKNFVNSMVVDSAIFVDRCGSFPKLLDVLILIKINIALKQVLVNYTNFNKKYEFDVNIEALRSRNRAPT